jgi:hypothetical protein
MHRLAESGIDFEAKLVRTQAEYVSALVKAKFGLIVADERAETVGAAADDLSLYEIAEHFSPGTEFVLISDLTDKAAETSRPANLTTISRTDLHRLKDILDRAVKDVEKYL